MMDEIEITPEMIEAGALALSEHHIEYESREEAVIRVYREMLSVSSQYLARPRGSENIPSGEVR